MALVSLHAIAVVIAAGSPAHAIEIDNDGLSREDTIAQQQNLRRWDNRGYGRSKSEFMPEGVRVGNYIIAPSVTVGTQYDDNLYASRTNKASDVRVDVSPAVRVTSQFARHALDFSFGGRFSEYLEYEKYNHNDGFFNATGALHIDSAHTLSFNVVSKYDHDSMMAPDSPTGASGPTPVWNNSVSVGLRRDQGRMWAAVGAKAQAWNYYDVRAFDGTVINQDNRDLEILSSNIRVGYRLWPGHEVIMQARALRQTTPGERALNRDASGYEVIAGMLSELNPVIRWRMFGGYSMRDFDRPELGTFGASVAEGQLQFFPSRVVTIYTSLRREIQEDGGTNTSAAGRIDNKATVRIEYEALRNLLFTIQGEYRVSQFVGIARTDELMVGRIGFEYLHTKNWVYRLSWENQHRMSDIPEAEYTRNRVMLEGTLRF